MKNEVVICMGFFNNLKSALITSSNKYNKLIEETYKILILEESVKDITNDAIGHYSDITQKDIVNFILSKKAAIPHIFYVKKEVFMNNIFPAIRRVYPRQQEKGYGLYDYKNNIIFVFIDDKSEVMNVAVHELDHFVRDKSGLNFNCFLSEISAYIVQFLSKYGNLNEAIYYTMQTIKHNYIGPEFDLDKLSDSLMFLSKEGILFKTIGSTDSLEEIISFSKNTTIHPVKTSHEGNESLKRSADETDRVLRILERNGISNIENFREELIKIYESAFVRNGKYEVVMTGKGRNVTNLVVLKNIEELYEMERKETKDFNIVVKLEIKSDVPTRPVLYR